MDRGQSFGNQEVITAFMDNGTSVKTININNNNNNNNSNNNNNNNNNNNLLVPGSTTQKTISAVDVSCGSSPGIDTSRRQDYDLDLVSYTGMHALPMTLTGSDVMSNVECPEFLLPVETFFFSGFQCLEEIAGGSTVAIDNKIEQAMDLVKRHLMYAVREEVEILKQQIGEMMERIGQLEYENSVLRSEAKPETLNKLQIPRVTQPPQPALPGQPATMVVAATPQQQPQQTVTQPPAASQPTTQVQPPQQSLQQPPPQQQQQQQHQQQQQQQHTSSSQAGQPPAT